MYGLGSADAMRWTQYTHDLRPCPMGVPSPQTPEQREQVTRVLRNLPEHLKPSKLLNVAQPAVSQAQVAPAAGATGSAPPAASGGAPPALPVSLLSQVTQSAPKPPAAAKPRANVLRPL